MQSLDTIPAAVDWLFHSGELLAFIVAAWAVIRRVNRDESLKRDYPPHRHVQGRIIYPREYTPAPIERIGNEGNA